MSIKKPSLLARWLPLPEDLRRLWQCRMSFRIRMTPEVMKQYMEKIRRDAHVHVIPYATITKGEQGCQVVDMAALKEMGICAFSDDGRRCSK